MPDQARHDVELRAHVIASRWPTLLKRDDATAQRRRALETIRG
jgi:hypothetical protein